MTTQTEALRDLLELVEAKFSWATEDGACDPANVDGEAMCSDCRECGCIRAKIDAARAALA